MTDNTTVEDFTTKVDNELSDDNNKQYKYVDNLPEDSEISGQKYVCLSFLSPEGVKGCKIRGLKIRGVYETKEEAGERCKQLSSEDPDFDVFVGEVGKWLPWNPDPNDAKDQVYDNEELNKLMNAHKENNAKAKKTEAERKAKLLQQASNEESASLALEKEKKNEELMKNKEAKKNLMKKYKEKLGKHSLTGKKKAKLYNKLKKAQETKQVVEEETRKANEERERLKEVSSEVVKQEENVEEIDKTISQMKELFNKLKTHDEKTNNAST